MMLSVPEMMCYILYQVSPLLPHGYPPHFSSEKPIRGRICHAILYFFCTLSYTLLLHLSSAFLSPPIYVCIFLHFSHKKEASFEALTQKPTSLHLLCLFSTSQNMFCPYHHFAIRCSDRNHKDNRSTTSFRIVVKNVHLRCQHIQL